MDTSSQVGEDVMSSDELEVVIGYFLSSTVILGFRDGIILGFFGAATLLSSEFWKLVFPQSC